jgi:subtilisin family serine protease
MKTSGKLPRGLSPATAALLTFAFLADAFLVPPPHSGGPSPLDRLARPSFCLAADATPDVEFVPFDPDPAGHRARLLDWMGARACHAAGFRGQGLTVAVLDSGFAGYRAQMGKALPAAVKAKSFRADGNLEARDSQHGVLCAEVLHALAPDAELLLANWEPERPESFLAAVRWARQEGARALTCSVIMPSWSDGEGHGPVHAELTRILGKGDKTGAILLFASAGNTARRHWSGHFRDAGGWHEWAPGVTENAVRPWGSERVSVELCWQGDARYEVVVTDHTARREVSRARWPGTAPTRCAVVAFTPEAGHDYGLRVRRLGAAAGPFHLVVLGGALAHSSRRGSIPFPGDGPEVVAVAAVNEQGRRASYSSCGPNSGRPKPDLSAMVPFPSLFRPRPFTGTSAAAPQAAGLAALVWSRHPDWTAEQVRGALLRAAVHAGPGRHDSETGYGRVHLPVDPVNSR